MKGLLRYEKVRFLVAGGLNTGLDFLLLNFLVFLIGTLPILANGISVTIGITISYFLNHYFVFRSSDPASLKKYVVFFAATGFSSLIIQSVIILGFAAFFMTDFSRSLFIMRDIAANEFIELNFAKVVAVIVGMVWNFLIYKYFIFKKREDDTDGSVETQASQAEVV